MRSDDITKTAATLQHTLIRLAHAIDDGAESHALAQPLLDLRFAALEHAAFMSEVIDAARAYVGKSGDVADLSMLLNALMCATQQLRDEIDGRRFTLVPLALTTLHVVVDELLSAERRLMTHCGTFLFPAETW